MGKFIKLLIILAVVTGLFMYYPNIAGYETDPQPAQQAATTQMQEQANPVSEYQQTESTLMTILPYLPDRDTWPDPLQKMFMLFTIENTVKERTAGMEWTARYTDGYAAGTGSHRGPRFLPPRCRRYGRHTACNVCKYFCR